MTDAPVLPWTIDAQRPVLDLGILTVRSVRARSQLRPDHASDFVVLDTADWVNVIALTNDDEVVLIEQYRHGTGAITLEIPGGMVDPGEDFLTAGARELAEETGYRGGVPEQIGVVEPNPALQSNRCATVLVRGVRQSGARALDPNEEIRVRTAPLADIPGLIRGGAITHALVVAAFHHLHLAGSP